MAASASAIGGEDGGERRSNYREPEPPVEARLQLTGVELWIVDGSALGAAGKHAGEKHGGGRGGHERRVDEAVVGEAAEHQLQGQQVTLALSL